MRRGASGGRADAFLQRNGRGGFQESLYSQAASSPAPLSFPSMPLPPPFDPSDPLAAMMAMQAMGLPPLPQVGSPSLYPPLGGQNLPSSHGPRRNPIRERCRDYDEKFYCERGDACPYEHGTDRLVASGQDGGFSKFSDTYVLISFRIRPKECGYFKPASYLSYVKRIRWASRQRFCSGEGERRPWRVHPAT